MTQKMTMKILLMTHTNGDTAVDGDDTSSRTSAKRANNKNVPTCEKKKGQNGDECGAPRTHTSGHARNPSTGGSTTPNFN
jgi:hypothetical protein